MRRPLRNPRSYYGWHTSSSLHRHSATTNRIEQEIAATRSYEDYQRELQELARRTSHDASAVDEALAVLDRLETAATPDTAIYNLVLEVHAFSRRQDAAEQAAALVARMEEQAASNTAAPPRPNSDTYATLMDAYMQQKSSSSMEKIEGLVERLRSGENNNNNIILVDTTILNKLIQAHGRRGDAEAALGILEDMLRHSNDSEYKHQRPNQKSWVHVLRAYAAKGNVTAVEELMERMMQQQPPDDDESTTTAAPSTAAYNALLQAHAKNGDTQAAERLLYRMLDDSSPDDETAAVPRPDHNSFYYVMQAYSRSRPKPGLVFKVERLLALQEVVQQQQQKDDNFTLAAQVQPNDNKTNDRILQAAVMAMARDTSDPLKALKAAQLVERIEDAPGRRRPYSCLLNACAYTLPNRVTDPHDKLAIWQIALDAFNHLVEEADSRVYGQLLRTAHHLLPPGRKRDAVAERVFQQCCEAGLVDAFVWTEYERVASDDLMLQQLGGFFEDGVKPPDEWSRNVEVV